MGKDVSQAEDMVKRIVKHYCDIEYMTPYMLLELDDWYLKRGQVNMAVIVWKQGPLYYSGLAEMYAFYKRLAEAYVKLDDKDNAIQCYLEYLKLYPHDSNALGQLNAITQQQ